MVAWWLLIVAFFSGLIVGIWLLCVVSANAREHGFDDTFFDQDEMRDVNEY